MKRTDEMVLSSLKKCKSVQLNITVNNYHLKQMALNGLHSILCNTNEIDRLF